MGSPAQCSSMFSVSFHHGVLISHIMCFIYSVCHYFSLEMDEMLHTLNRFIISTHLMNRSITSVDKHILLNVVMLCRFDPSYAVMFILNVLYIYVDTYLYSCWYMIFMCIICIQICAQNQVKSLHSFIQKHKEDKTATNYRDRGSIFRHFSHVSYSTKG